MQSFVSQRTVDGVYCDFDASKLACSKFGFQSGQKVITSSGLAKVIGVYDNDIWFHIEGQKGASHWDSASARFVGYHKDKDFICYNSEIIQFDVRDEVCSAYGFLSGQRVHTGGFHAKTIIGVYRGDLYEHSDGSIGARVFRSNHMTVHKLPGREQVKPYHLQASIKVINDAWLITELHPMPTSDMDRFVVDENEKVYYNYQDCIWEIESASEHQDVHRRILPGYRLLACFKGEIVAEKSGRIFKFNFTPHNPLGRVELLDLKETMETATTVDKNGIIYLGTKHTLYAVNLKQPQDQLSNFPKHMQCPTNIGIAVDDDGALYIHNPEHSQINKLKDDVLTTLPLSLKDTYIEQVSGMLLTKEGLLVIGDEGFWRLDIKRNLETQFLEEPEKFTCHTTDQNGNIYVYTNYDRILKLENRWKYERVLWIGKLKEDKKDCQLVVLPIDIIKVIIMLMRAQHGVTFDYFVVNIPLLLSS